MDKTKQLGTEPIGKLLTQYSVPAIIAMIVNAVYNIIDRIFIAQYAGESALAGLTVTFPIMMLIIAFASLIGSGSASIMAIKLGKNDKEGVSQTFGNSLTLGSIVAVLFMIVCYPNMNFVLSLLGANSSLLSYAADYMNIILIGFIFQMTSFVLSSSVRIEGNPMLSMTSMLVGAITNIILDYVFIGVLSWGVKGAAIATVAGQILGFLVLLSFYMRKRSILLITKENFIPKFEEIKDIVSVGFTSFLSTIGASVASVFLNRSLITYGGNAAITAIGAISSLSTLFLMPMIGIQQGMQPIISYNHGSMFKDRVNKTLLLSVVVSSLFAVIVFICLQLYPEAFMSMFLSKESSTMQVAVTGLRYYILMLPGLGIGFIGSAYFQAIAKSKEAIILGSLRQFILLIPLVIILPKLFGLTGVWLSTPVADAITILATAVLLIKDIRTPYEKVLMKTN
ncbi:MATE family efflux transporter [Tepidibacter hydrothermalis]|uniref:Multidrug export protein MepA n=1 Tax=Tepidibacter hydrothermalis TaxID=3036126 RepID=A0ABY8EB89_9FIRM|nr:MATE family efflux transporter [Tepidibacter hydrothermalis]WFD10207.1 MATE family efflux transporter [Tepidibacter hydrothermalis]